MTSDRFQKVFDSGSGSIARQCTCGRMHYNYMDGPCFDEGELEEYEKKSDSDPDQYIPHDHSIGYMNVPCAGEVVYDCPCGLAEKFEQILIDNARTIAKYLNEYAHDLRERASEVEVKE
jgi:hypothetical protein